MRFLFAALLICPLTVYAAVDVPAPGDFAYGFDIITERDAAIYRVTLSEAVYQSVVRADLGDVRLFNGNQEVVPHAINRPRQEAKSTLKPDQTLPFFPLSAQTQAQGRMHLEIDSKGAIIDITEGSVSADHVDAYIIDGGTDATLITRLQLTWSSQQASFLSQVELKSSADLNQWRHLQTDTLARLHFADQLLAQDELKLTKRPDRYLKLSWPQGKKGAALTRVRASFKPSNSFPAFTRRHTSVVGHPGDAGNTWEFDLGAPLATDRAELRLTQANSLLKVRLSSRATQDANWRQRHQGLFYALSVEGTKLESRGAHFDVSRERYWRLQVIGGDTGAIQQAPVMEFAWVADEVFFMARGNGPFVLGAGNPSLNVPAQPVDTLLGSLNATQRGALINQARLGPRRPIGGPASLQAPPQPPPWEKITLWSVLILAVLVMSWMALRLYRQMNPTDPP